MHVLATRLWEALSITLVNDGSGWRFSNWSTVTDRCPAMLPSGDDRQRRFGDAREAVDYFRRQYAHLAD